MFRPEAAAQQEGGAASEEGGGAAAVAVAEAAAEAEPPKDRCPEGTFVYHSGSHCCKHNVDRDGRPIGFHSLTCKDNSYVPCPAGAEEGSCRK